MKSFNFKEYDKEGYQSLDVIAEAGKFNQWMYETIKPWCGGEILEIGSGTGNISSFFIAENHKITLSDIRNNYLEVLRKKFTDVIGVYYRKIDISDPDFEEKYNDLHESFDSVFALNVIEHIHDDTSAIRNCQYLLKPGGNMIILVPAYQKLYNKFDQGLEHYRRYTAKSLINLFDRNHISVITSRYFNFVGIFGWYVSGKLQGNPTIPGGQMKLYDKLVPLFRIIDKLMLNKVGLSVIVIGQKKRSCNTPLI